MKKFWNWITNQDGGRTLRLEGPIDSENFWGDEVTPAWFRSELEAGEGDVTVWINSPGGNVFAAAEIYTMLRDYKGKVTVKIDAIAASAASVIAMAGDTVQMSPVAMLMIHDPATVAMGNAADMQKAIDTLNEVKESIINAYMVKSNLTHNKIAKLMSDETWLNAKKCLDMGFCDEILFSNEAKKNPFAPKEEDPEENEPDKDAQEGDDPNEDTDPEEEKKKGVHLYASIYSTKLMNQMILNRLGVTALPNTIPAVEDPAPKEKEPAPPVIGMDGRTEDGSVPFMILEKQLECLK